jgi:hypothetical protein
MNVLSVSEPVCCRVVLIWAISALISLRSFVHSQHDILEAIWMEATTGNERADAGAENQRTLRRKKWQSKPGITNCNLPLETSAIRGLSTEARPERASMQSAGLSRMSPHRVLAR